MNKKLIVAGVISTGVATMALAVPGLVAAQTDSNVESTFVQKLAAKLGLDEDTVQTAIDSTKEEIKTEKDAEIETEINSAVSEGSLTQRQADILITMLDVKLEAPIRDSEFVDPSTLTDEERKAQMEERRTQMDQSIVDSLNEAGLNTTSEEVSAARKAAKDAGIRFGFGGMHRGGPGGFMM